MFWPAAVAVSWPARVEELRAHDRVPGERVRPLKVVRRTRRDVAVDHRLGRPAAGHDHELLMDVPRRLERTVTAGDHRQPAGAARARRDRQALELRPAWGNTSHERVPGLVTGHNRALLRGQGGRRRPGQRAQTPLGEVGSGDLGAALARRHDRALVQHLAQVRARGARRCSAISRRGRPRARAGGRARARADGRAPSALGSSMLTWREKRPGRSSADQHVQPDVAPTHTSRSLPVKPSISMRSRLSVCSYSSFRSGLPPPLRRRPSASSSSMKTTAPPPPFGRG